MLYHIRKSSTTQHLSILQVWTLITKFIHRLGDPNHKLFQSTNTRAFLTCNQSTLHHPTTVIQAFRIFAQGVFLDAHICLYLGLSRASFDCWGECGRRYLLLNWSMRGALLVLCRLGLKDGGLGYICGVVLPPGIIRGVAIDVSIAWVCSLCHIYGHNYPLSFIYTCGVVPAIVEVLLMINNNEFELRVMYECNKSNYLRARIYHHNR